LTRLLMGRISIMWSGCAVALVLLGIWRMTAVCVIWCSLVLIISLLRRRIGAVLAGRRRLVGRVRRRIRVLLWGVRTAALSIRIVAAVALSLRRLTVLRLLVVLVVLALRRRLVVAALSAIVLLTGHGEDIKNRFETGKCLLFTRS